MEWIVPLDLHGGKSDQQQQVCSMSRWELDTRHGIPAPIKESMQISFDSDEKDLDNKLRRASYYFIFDAVAKLKQDSRDKWKLHHQVLYNWMEHIVALDTSGVLCAGSQSWGRASAGVKQMLNDQLQARGPAGQLTVRVGEHLERIFRGEVTPLEVMMADNLLDRCYLEHPRLRSHTYKHLARIVELYAVKNPGAKVLEIGAGTGGATQTVLEGFEARGDGAGSLLGHYTFTDVSAGFF